MNIINIVENKDFREPFQLMNAMITSGVSSTILLYKATNVLSIKAVFGAEKKTLYREKFSK